MPKRNDKRDTAKAEYIKRRRSGEKVNLKDLAEKLGVTYGTVRNWKRIDQWDDAVERKRGGQPGNKNSRGKRNAKGNPGGGAPNGNTNAEKDGAYSTVHLERLSQEERDWLDQMPTGANENNIYELKLLRIQQRHIMERIAEYESCDPESCSLHPSPICENRERTKTGSRRTELCRRWSWITRTVPLFE